jgi:tetratricopeptide (TPR) repeat protein
VELPVVPSPRFSIERGVVFALVCFLGGGGVGSSLCAVWRAVLTRPSRPHDVDVELEKIVNLRALGSVDEALSLIEALLAHNPENGDAWSHKGAIMREAKRFGDAVRALEQALAVDAELEGAKTNLALSKAAVCTRRCSCSRSRLGESEFTQCSVHRVGFDVETAR